MMHRVKAIRIFSVERSFVEIFTYVADHSTLGRRGAPQGTLACACRPEVASAPPTPLFRGSSDPIPKLTGLLLRKLG